MKNLNDLLTRRDAAEHFLAERLLLDPSDELLGNLEIDIRFQQREAHLPERVIDVGFADRAMTAKVLKDVLKLVAELRKHTKLSRLTGRYFFFAAAGVAEAAAAGVVAGAAEAAGGAPVPA